MYQLLIIYYPNSDKMTKKLLKTLFLTVLLWGVSMQMKADGYALLTIVQNGGSTVEYQMVDIQKFTFDNENMYLHLTNGDKKTMPFSTLLYITVGSDITGISLIGKEPVALEVKNGMLNVNMREDGTVILYDQAGKTVRTIAVHAGQNSISLGKMPKGMYLVKVNGNSQKILNK